MFMANISVIGAGSVGTAIASELVADGHTVSLIADGLNPDWIRFPD